ncbi:MAG: hypothetical protein UU12_C0004G0002 [Candidatus Woesebacteria bacterium GW2011_GWA2_40_7b]|uniref:Uncharacterized protein n=1 Tax=Candidatus Woesebacteria bacterium GW2011_GWA2_40_7b TaxID=1618563 RepID=A0A0G0VGS1_9BACT|nr:MAG: hypothetical protein UU12_C0004G0002 [Candidatus Woesebacteria bacterium GW2011_GWA2_40_7b]
MELKFQVEIHSDKSRAFHTNVVVGKSSIDHYAFWLSGSYENALHDQGQIVANMVRDLFRLGVHDIFVKPYEVSVYIDDSKRPWRRWDERIDEIVENTFKELGRIQGIPSGKKVVIGKSQSGRLEYHTNFEVSRSVIEDFKRPLRDSSGSYLTKIGSEGASLVRKLMALPGTTEIWMHPYEVSVSIGQAFSWTERDDNGKTLEDKIKLAFENVFGNITFVTK